MNKLMPISLALALAILAGCNQTARTPATARSEHGEFRRAHDPRFTAQDRRLIAAADAKLAGDARVTDAYHRVRAADGGHEVFVLFVSGYEGDEPQFKPCDHAAVRFDADGDVIEVLRGPECWP